MYRNVTLPHVFSLMLFLFLCSCATSYPDSALQVHLKRSVDAQGIPDHSINTKMREKIEEKIDERKKPSNNVQAFVTKLPKGLKYEAKVSVHSSKFGIGANLVNKSGYKHKIIGTFEVRKYFNFYKSFYWTSDFKNPTIDVYCGVQAPLKAVTLGVWNVVPLAWPCYIPKQEFTPKDSVNEAKIIAQTAGGDGVVVSYQYFENNRDNRPYVFSYTGAIFKRDPRFKGKKIPVSNEKVKKGKRRKADL